MLVWGQTVLKARLDGIAFVIYWTACFVFTFLAMMTALLDIWLIRRKQRQDRKKLMKDAFTQIERPTDVQDSNTNPSENVD